MPIPAAIDASIYRSVGVPQQPPNMIQNATHALTMRHLAMGIQQQQALQAAFRKHTTIGPDGQPQVDFNGAIGDLYASGYGTVGAQLQKERTQTQLEQANLDIARTKRASDMLGAYAQIFRSVTTPEQFAAQKPLAVQAGIPDAYLQWPGAQGMQAMVSRALTEKDAQDLKIKQAQLALTERGQNLIYGSAMYGHNVALAGQQNQADIARQNRDQQWEIEKAKMVGAGFTPAPLAPPGGTDRSQAGMAGAPPALLGLPPSGAAPAPPGIQAPLATMERWATPQAGPGQTGSAGEPDMGRPVGAGATPGRSFRDLLPGAVTPSPGGPADPAYQATLMAAKTAAEKGYTATSGGGYTMAPGGWAQVAANEAAIGRQAALQKELAGQGLTQTPTGVAPIQGSKTELEREARQSADDSALVRFVQSQQGLKTAAINLAAHPGLSQITGYAGGRLPPALQVTDNARAAAADLENLRSRAFKGFIDDMKTGNPSGSTGIGRLMQAEIPFATSQQASLDRLQGTEDFQNGLGNIAAHVDSSLPLAVNAHDSVYGPGASVALLQKSGFKIISPDAVQAAAKASSQTPEFVTRRALNNGYLILPETLRPPSDEGGKALPEPGVPPPQSAAPTAALVQTPTTIGKLIGGHLDAGP